LAADEHFVSHLQSVTFGLIWLVLIIA